VYTMTIMIDHLSTQFTPFLAHGALAIFGAFTHAAVAYRSGDTKNLGDFAILMLISSFSGVMFAIVGAEWFGPDSYKTLAMTGTGGFIGIEGMTWVTAFIKSKFK